MVDISLIRKEKEMRPIKFRGKDGVTDFLSKSK
jgi:hypothetical protein